MLWDVELTSKLYFEGANTILWVLMVLAQGHIPCCHGLWGLDWVLVHFSFMHKDALTITQGSIGVNEQSLWIELID